MNNLKKIREKHGYTQDYVAKKIGVSESTYSRYESEKRKLDSDTLKKLSELFNVSIDYLTGNIDEPISPAEIRFLEDMKKKSTDALLEQYDLHDAGKDLSQDQQREIIELLKTSSLDEVEKMLKVLRAMKE
jgi:transcriptional regulator with XRE-family HTH domain